MFPGQLNTPALANVYPTIHDKKGPANLGINSVND